MSSCAWVWVTVENGANFFCSLAYKVVAVSKVVTVWFLSVTSGLPKGSWLPESD